MIQRELRNLSFRKQLHVLFMYLGLGCLASYASVMFFVFVMAFLSSDQKVVIAVNFFNEAVIEFFVMVTTVFFMLYFLVNIMHEGSFSKFFYRRKGA